MRLPKARSTTEDFLVKKDVKESIFLFLFKFLWIAGVIALVTWSILKLNGDATINERSFSIEVSVFGLLAISGVAAFASYVKVTKKWNKRKLKVAAAIMSIYFLVLFIEVIRWIIVADEAPGHYLGFVALFLCSCPIASSWVLGWGGAVPSDQNMEEISV